MKINIDDVPIGLSLMTYTPFRFSCNKLWFKRINDISIPYTAISRFINPQVNPSHIIKLTAADTKFTNPTQGQWQRKIQG